MAFLNGAMARTPPPLNTRLVLKILLHVKIQAASSLVTGAVHLVSNVGKLASGPGSAPSSHQIIITWRQG